MIPEQGGERKMNSASHQKQVVDWERELSMKHLLLLSDHVNMHLGRGKSRRLNEVKIRITVKT